MIKTILDYELRKVKTVNVPLNAEHGNGKQKRNKLAINYKRQMDRFIFSPLIIIGPFCPFPVHREAVSTLPCVSCLDAKRNPLISGMLRCMEFEIIA